MFWCVSESIMPQVYNPKKLTDEFWQLVDGESRACGEMQWRRWWRGTQEVVKREEATVCMHGLPSGQSWRESKCSKVRRLIAHLHLLVLAVSPSFLLGASPPQDANAAGNGQLAVTFTGLPPWCPCTQPTVSQENAGTGVYRDTCWGGMPPRGRKISPATSHRVQAGRVLLLCSDQ